jgi:YD repeat-containing protein
MHSSRHMNNASTSLKSNRNRYEQTVAIDADGIRTTTTYDAARDPVAVTDPKGLKTDYGYDALGNITRQTNSSNNVTQTEYNADGRKTLVIDPMGNQRYYNYDGLGRETGACWQCGF